MRANFTRTDQSAHVTRDLRQVLTEVGKIGMVIDRILKLDAAKQQHSDVGVHEEDQHEERANIVEGRQGDNQRGQQRLQALHSRAKRHMQEFA